MRKLERPKVKVVVVVVVVFLSVDIRVRMAVMRVGHYCLLIVLIKDKRRKQLF